MAVTKFRLRVAYDGRPFYGFQIQPGKPSVQETIEDGIWRLTGERVRVGYAGRTDTGVHAYDQVITFETSRDLTERSVVGGLNVNLPDSVVVWEAKQVPLDFDPRRSALSRTYRYTIENRTWPTPFLRGLCWHVREPLDAGRMHEAAQALVGVQDLAGLTEKSGLHLPSTTRRVDRVAVTREGGNVYVEIEANAFLPHIVRNLVGTLVWIGSGRRDVGHLGNILAGRDRRNAGPAAPGDGLYLLRVRYPDDEPAMAGKGAQP